jgi:AI-2 transport protein TqsA
MVLVCLLIITAVALGFALFWLKPVLIPLILAALFAQALWPLIAVLSKTMRLPRWLAILLALALGGGVFVGLGSIVSHSTRAFAANASVYEVRIEHLAAQAMDWLAAHGLPDGKSLVQDIPVSSMAQSAAKAAVSVFSNGLLVFICLMFLLQGTPRTPRVGGVTEKVQSRVRRYLMIKLSTSTVTGVLVGLSLWLAGVELALTFAVLTFLLNFIPSVGSIVAVLLPLPVLLLNADATVTTYLLAFGLPMVVQGLVGNVVEPRLMGESLELHPITVLMGLIFWGALWGIPGMFLAAPLTAVFKIVLEQSALTEPLARLLSGRLGAEA